MSQFFQSISTLLASQRLDGSHATSLVLERLYYADGRHNPNHPRHGSFEGLVQWHLAHASVSSWSWLRAELEVTGATIDLMPQVALAVGVLRRVAGVRGTV